MLRKRLNSFRFAFKGIGWLFRSQVNAKIHLFAAIVVLLAGYFLELSITEWCLTLFAIFTVLAAEAFNTALEDLTDLVSPDHHPLAGRAKDLAAGAVLLTALGAASIGLLIFVPKLWALLK